MTREDVYNIFKEFFTEDLVDMQGYYIIVRFPKLRVTNEYDKFIDITELYVKLVVSGYGYMEGDFTMMRTEYTKEQIESGYSHSHIPNIYNRIIWSHPCLGTGPILNTIRSLAVDPSEELWNLFCVELSKYVRTESIKGVPYVRLEHVGNNNKGNKYIDYSYNRFNFFPDCLSSFIEYIIKEKPFGFAYIDKFYTIADSFENIAIKLSNLFIKWYNNLSKKEQDEIGNPIEGLILNKCVIYKGGIYIKQVNSRVSSIENRDDVLLRFKGEDLKLNIIDNEDSDNNEILILNNSFLSYIINRITLIINYNNGKTPYYTRRKVFFY